MRKQVGFWRLAFVAFSLIAVALDVYVAILGVQNLHLAGLMLPFSYLFVPWGHPGGPWEQHEGQVVIRSRTFNDFEMNWGPRVERFLCLDGLNFLFLLGLFPGYFSHRFLYGINDSWSSLNKVVVRKLLQKPCFRKNHFLVIRGSIVNNFWKPWEWFF